MGTYSSWAAFALTHHLVVQWAARRAAWKAPRFVEYTILGDDIVIADESVALQYQELMRLLGVEINMTKSVVSSGAAEFAKRTFVDGEELTGLLWSAFNAAAESPFGYFQMVSEVRRRGFEVSLAGCVLGALGKSSTRKVGPTLRSVFLALVEPGGPLESLGIWRLVLPAALVEDYHEAFNTGALSVDQASIRPQDTARWAIATQLSAGVEVAPLLRGAADFELLRGSLPSLLGTQLRDSALRGRTVSNEAIRQLLLIHPVGEITDAQIQEEFGFPRRSPRLRILSRADKEFLTSQRQHMLGALDRAYLVQMAYVGK
jgi:hypothetical protein